MRLRQVSSRIANGFALINVENITMIELFPAETDGFWEVDVTFDADNWREFWFKDIGHARQFIADLAGMSLEDMNGQGMLLNE